MEERSHLGPGDGLVGAEAERRGSASGGYSGGSQGFGGSDHSVGLAVQVGEHSPMARGQGDVAERGGHHLGHVRPGDQPVGVEHPVRRLHHPGGRCPPGVEPVPGAVFDIAERHLGIDGGLTVSMYYRS